MLGEKHVCVWRAHRHGRKGHTGGWGPAQLGTHCGKTRIYTEGMPRSNGSFFQRVNF